MNDEFADLSSLQDEAMPNNGKAAWEALADDNPKKKIIILMKSIHSFVENFHPHIGSKTDDESQRDYFDALETNKLKSAMANICNLKKAGKDTNPANPQQLAAYARNLANAIQDSNIDKDSQQNLIKGICRTVLQTTANQNISSISLHQFKKIIECDAAPDSVSEFSTCQLVSMESTYSPCGKCTVSCFGRQFIDTITGIKKDYEKSQQESVEQTQPETNITIPLTSYFLPDSRKDIIESVMGMLHIGASPIWLHGIGGIGKSSIAIEIANQLNVSNHETVLFVSYLCKTSARNAIDSNLPAILHGLAPATILLLDNFYVEGKTLSDLLDEPCHESTVEQELLRHRCIITTRYDPKTSSFPYEIKVGALSESEQFSLFSYWFPSAAREPLIINDLLLCLYGNTFLIELFAKTLDSRDSARRIPPLTPKALLEQFKHTGWETTDPFTKVTIDRDGHRSRQRVDEVLNLLFDFSQFSDDENLLLGHLSVLPNEVFTSDELKEFESSIEGVSENSFYDTLYDLIDRGWISIKEGKVWTHDLIKSLSNSRIPTSPNDAVQISKHFCDKYCLAIYEDDGERAALFFKAVINCFIQQLSAYENRPNQFTHYSMTVICLLLIEMEIKPGFIMDGLVFADFLCKFSISEAEKKLAHNERSEILCLLGDYIGAQEDKEIADLIVCEQSASVVVKDRMIDKVLEDRVLNKSEALRFLRELVAFANSYKDNGFPDEAHKYAERAIGICNLLIRAEYNVSESKNARTQMEDLLIELSFDDF